jgi:hypothetical protein
VERNSGFSRVGVALSNLKLGVRPNAHAYFRIKIQSNANPIYRSLNVVVTQLKNYHLELTLRLSSTV